MEDTFVIFYNAHPLVALTGLNKSPYPDREQVLDWYGENFDFDRKRLTGVYVHSYSTDEHDYRDMLKQKGMLRP